jgi:hypothetical protein
MLDDLLTYVKDFVFGTHFNIRNGHIAVSDYFYDRDKFYIKLVTSVVSGYGFDISKMYAVLVVKDGRLLEIVYRYDDELSADELKPDNMYLIEKCNSEIVELVKNVNELSLFFAPNGNRRVLEEYQTYTHWM